jgi:hypothetical protein
MFFNQKKLSSKETINFELKIKLMNRLKIAFIFCFMSMSLLAQEETSVLFIGNSYTFMNNMPFIFKEIAENKGKKMFVDTVVEGGKNLEYHASQNETFQTINSRKWDYVVVQAHSNELAQPDTKVDKNTLPFAQKIIDSVRANNPCTQVLLYMTWGYKYGNPKWSPIATYDSMQYRIKNQYIRFADLLNTQLSPVGEVWKHIRTNHSGINLYDPDNHHPSLEGSYLSACTFFASIFGESPVQNKAVVDLKPDTRQIIEFSAAQIVLNNLAQWRYVPNKIRPEGGFDMFLSGNELKIYDRSKNATQIEWEFGDGTTESTLNPVKTYENPGIYTITQKVSNHCNTKFLQRTIEIKGK